MNTVHFTPGEKRKLLEHLHKAFDELQLGLYILSGKFSMYYPLLHRAWRTLDKMIEAVENDSLKERTR